MSDRVELVPADFPGCYFVTVDEDPEHKLSTYAMSEKEAKLLVVEIAEELKEEERLGHFRKILRDVEFDGWKFLVDMDGERPVLQVASTTPCNTSGEPFSWKGRKWFLSPHMTKSELVQTALKAVLTATEHEVRERFLYRGVSVFDPHYDVDALHELRSCTSCLDTRS